MATKRKYRRRAKAGLLGQVNTRDIVILGMAGVVIWAFFRKPVQVETKVDWTSQALADLKRAGVVK